MSKCVNGCPPGTDLRTCMLAFMGECPLIKANDGDIYYNDQIKVQATR